MKFGEIITDASPIRTVATNHTKPLSPASPGSALVPPPCRKCQRIHSPLFRCSEVSPSPVRQPLPSKIMVLCPEPALTHSVWCDYITRARTMNGLMRELRREIKAGHFVAYRFITIHEQHYGLPNTENGDQQKS